MNLSSKEEKIFADFLNRPFPARAASLLEFSIEEIQEWKDYTPGQKPYYNLRLFSDQEICTIGEATFHALHTRLTLRSVANLLLLAFHLTDSSGQRLFDEALPVEVANPVLCKEFDEVPDRQLQTAATAATYRISIPSSHPNYTQKMSKAFCFWATSMLRLLTMSPENYTQTANHLAARFKTFYNYPFPIHNYEITQDVALLVKANFHNDEILQHTSYILLVAGEKRVAGEDIKQFLHKMNVSYSGLHCFHLFLKVMEGYKVSDTTLIDVMSTRGIQKELTSIAHVFNHLYDANLPGYQLQMWKYARIFEHGFLSSLQTKNCAYFAAVLAFMLHELGSAGELNIFHIRNLGETSKAEARDHALRAVKLIRKTQS